MFGDEQNAMAPGKGKDPMKAAQSKIAIVHDFLYCYGGAERVLEQILRVFPDAQLFSLFDFLPAEHRGFLGGRTVIPSFLQRLPFARWKHRSYLPLMPLAIEQLDVSQYDIVISSSYVAAKGVITRADQFHVCYCHSPARFAWDLQHQYLAGTGLVRGLRSMLARMVLHYIRNWDARSANGVDAFVSNSHYVGRRIQKIYRRASTPIYPPVDVDKFPLRADKDDFYLTASRLVPYKRIDLVVDAFSRMPQKRLIVIGEGPEMKKLRSRASSNVTLMDYQSSQVLRDHMQRARAFIFAAEEDFGIVPVEAQACGTPVIAFGRGGAMESIVEGSTGVFFQEQSVASLMDAIARFEASPRWDCQRIRENAQRFSPERFRRQFSTLVESEYASFRAGARTGRTEPNGLPAVVPDPDWAADQPLPDEIPEPARQPAQAWR